MECIDSLATELTTKPICPSGLQFDQEVRLCVDEKNEDEKHESSCAIFPLELLPCIPEKIRKCIPKRFHYFTKTGGCVHLWIVFGVVSCCILLFWNLLPVLIGKSPNGFGAQEAIELLFMGPCLAYFIHALREFDSDPSDLDARKTELAQVRAVRGSIRALLAASVENSMAFIRFFEMCLKQKKEKQIDEKEEMEILHDLREMVLKWFTIFGECSRNGITAPSVDIDEINIDFGKSLSLEDLCEKCKTQWSCISDRGIHDVVFLEDEADSIQVLGWCVFCCNRSFHKSAQLLRVRDGLAEESCFPCRCPCFGLGHVIILSSSHLFLILGFCVGLLLGIHMIIQGTKKITFGLLVIFQCTISVTLVRFEEIDRRHRALRAARRKAETLAKAANGIADLFSIAIKVLNVYHQSLLNQDFVGRLIGTMNKKDAEERMAEKKRIVSAQSESNQRNIHVSFLGLWCRKEATDMTPQIDALSNIVNELGQRTQHDSASFVERIIAEVWPKISTYLAGRMKERFLQKRGCTSLTVDVSLGETPFEIGPIVTQGSNWGSSRDIMLRCDFAFKGSASAKVQAAAIQGGIKNIRLQGILSIVLHELIERPPFVSGVSLFFANAPRMTLDMSGAAKVASSIVGPSLKHTVMNFIREEFCEICVLPKRIQFVFDKSEESRASIKALRPLGCLRLTLMSPRDLSGRPCDPSVEIRLGEQSYTRKFNDESLDLYVYDRSMHLNLDVFDKHSQRSHVFLGRVEIGVAKIVGKCSGRPTWFKLENDVGETEKVTGEVQVLAVWMPVVKNARSKATPDYDRSVLMSLNLDSVVIPREAQKLASTYSIEVSYNDKPIKIFKAKTEKAKALAEELQEKITKLQDLRATDEDIEILLSTKPGTTRLRIDDSVLWIAKKTNQPIRIIVWEGKKKVGSVETSPLMKMVAQGDSDILETGNFENGETGPVKCVFRARVFCFGDICYNC